MTYSGYSRQKRAIAMQTRTGNATGGLRRMIAGYSSGRKTADPTPARWSRTGSAVKERPYCCWLRRRNFIENATKPRPRRDMVPASGTAAGVNVKVAENVLLTLPVVCNCCSTCWYGTVNWLVKLPRQFSCPSLVTPVNTKVAVACGPSGAGGGLFTKLKGEPA